MPSVIQGEVLQWDFQMDAWVLIMLPNGIRCDDRRVKAGITAEKLLSRGMEEADIHPRITNKVSSCNCR